MALETIACPYCGSANARPWAQERGFTVVRCECRLLFVNPRPTQDLIHTAVSTGVHGEEAGGLVAIARRSPSKIPRYRRVFAHMFPDVWSRSEPISWLDVGSGYGEILEAIAPLAPAGSHLEGLEPMGPKAEVARSRGLTITEDYLRRDHLKVDFVSSIDVFSHIPDYAKFLDDIRAVLNPRGEVFIETGNLADLEQRIEFPEELGVPDHLVFAGEKHLVGFLDRAGFDLVKLETVRVDGILHFAKTVAKKILGRPVQVNMPYTSKYRQLLIRARLR
tara:strand:+ start:12438 stop:13268 length:831 start_codon:yes stop_codon:yes gene_type:complete